VASESALGCAGPRVPSAACCPSRRESCPSKGRPDRGIPPASSNRPSHELNDCTNPTLPPLPPATDYLSVGALPVETDGVTSRVEFKPQHRSARLVV
jgi:hypothetical protein